MAAENRRREEEERTKRLRERIIQCQNGSTVPPHFKRVLAEGFKSTEPRWDKYLNHCRPRLLARGAVFAFVGTRGAGKTICACTLIQEHHAKGISAEYITAMGFFVRLKSTFSREAAHTEESLLRSLVAPKLLVIDEAQERSDSPWTDRLLNYLVDQRYQNDGDTILIANQTPEEFTASVGPTIADRAREAGGLLVFNWPSLRGKAAG